MPRPPDGPVRFAISALEVFGHDVYRTCITDLLPQHGTAMRIRVDAIDRAGHCLCAELFPEWVKIDEWGYPSSTGNPFQQPFTAMPDAPFLSSPNLPLVLEKSRYLSDLLH